MSRTGGVLLRLTDQATPSDGEWFQVLDPASKKILGQITMADTGTVTIEGRMGPDHEAVELASTTDADWSVLINSFPQMRARLTAVGATPPDVLVAVNAATFNRS